MGSHGVYGKATTCPHGMEKPNYRGPDGLEPVQMWSCEPTCPVPDLDEQSGVSRGVIRKPTGKALFSTTGKSLEWNANSMQDTVVRGHADEGGASRFFRQVKK
jgi:hypothetical protein